MRSSLFTLSTRIINGFHSHLAKLRFKVEELFKRRMMSQFYDGPMDRTYRGETIVVNDYRTTVCAIACIEEPSPYKREKFTFSRLRKALSNFEITKRKKKNVKVIVNVALKVVNETRKHMRVKPIHVPLLIDLKKEESIYSYYFMQLNS